MTVSIMVFEFSILVRVGDGMLHRCYDWIMVFDFIRDEDTVTIQNYRGYDAR
jgi:hypothetical protein